MMTNDADMTATAAALTEGRITARELLARHLADIGGLQPALNCFVAVDEAGAGRAAADADQRRRQGASLSAIDGIPIALKDNINVEGLTTRNGSTYLHPVIEDAAVSHKLRAAGAVILGKLNMDECAIGAATDNPHYGRTHNPWRRGFIPGGSSGGAASAVAAGLAWAALGTDTLGSVRLPAGYCGIVGLKATHGLIDMTGIVPLSKTLDHVGPLCRSVRDARFLVGLLAGPTPAGWSAKAPPRDDLAGLKVGVLEQVSGPDCTEEVADGFSNALDDLRRLGADTVALTLPDLEPRRLRREAFLIIEAEGAEALAASLQAEPAAYSDNLKAMLDYGRDLPAARRRSAYQALAEAKTALTGLFDKVDLLVSPTAPQTAFSFDDPAPANQAEISGLANISGCPAISLPCGLSPSGLPLAFQIMAAPYDEATLLAAAEVLENTWGRLTPPEAGV